MNVVIIILFVLFALGISSIITKSHKSQIENKVISKGGIMIGYERRSFLTGLGPFKIVGKGQDVYKFDYEINGERKEGWVRFYGLNTPEWKL